MKDSAVTIWQRLSGLRSDVIRKAERFAALTIPKLCLPDGVDEKNTDIAHDYQSIGARAVNHLTNRMMLAMFAPSRPFFKMRPSRKEMQRLVQESGASEQDIASILALAERDAVGSLDGMGQRPKLYQVFRHLIAIGNVLLFLDKKRDMLRVMSLKYFCVKRNADGSVHTLIIKECIKFDELEQSVQDALPSRYQPDSAVEHYRLIQKDGGDMVMSQWVNEHRLPSEFNGKWPTDECPYHVLAWDLGDDADYGTGLVEEYSGDFEAISVLSESVVDGAVLAAEFRWLADPTSQTSIEDYRKSINGDVLAGRKDDLHAATSGNYQAVSAARDVLQDFERRVGQVFLLASSMQRDAERVTAEEVRLTAMELETSLGGVYSTLAVAIQKPIAKWLLESIDVAIKGTAIDIVILTGLDALSRNGDLENLRLALSDLAQITALPPTVVEMIDIDKIAAFIGQGRGVELQSFLLTPQQRAANAQERQQQAVQTESAIAAGKAAADESTQVPQ